MRRKLKAWGNRGLTYLGFWRVLKRERDESDIYIYTYTDWAHNKPVDDIYSCDLLCPIHFILSPTSLTSLWAPHVVVYHFIYTIIWNNGYFGMGY